MSKSHVRLHFLCRLAQKMQIECRKNAEQIQKNAEEILQTRTRAFASTVQAVANGEVVCKR